jgi:hypothetical protein
MRLVGVVFLEAALVEQQFEPLARRQLALGVLHVDAASARPRAAPVRAAAQPLR